MNNAWEKMREDKVRREVKEEFDNIKSDDIDILDISKSSSHIFKSNNKNSRFVRVIGA